MTGRDTGHRHSKCYARELAGCSTKISKEHFISEVLLRRVHLNDTAKIAGLAWQQPGHFNIVPVKGLASNILCERHNNALSTLDATIAMFADTIQRFDRMTQPGDEAVRFNGNNLERWMLKCLLGLSASKNLKSSMKPECVGLLFGRTDWPKGWGLYFSGLGQGPIYHTDSLLIETLTGPDRQLTLGAKFYVQGLPFTLVLGKPGDGRAFGLWRPPEIVFRLPIGTKKISVQWAGGSSDHPVELTRMGAYDGHPPSWSDWERNG